MQLAAQTSRALGVATSAVISHMHAPLGLAVGNSLEVEEALACLRGAGPPDLRELVVVEGAMLLLAAGRVATMQEGRQAIAGVLDSGEARDRSTHLATTTHFLNVPTTPFANVFQKFSHISVQVPADAGGPGGGWGGRRQAVWRQV